MAAIIPSPSSPLPPMPIATSEFLAKRPLKALTTHTDLQFTYFGGKEVGEARIDRGDDCNDERRRDVIWRAPEKSIHGSNRRSDVGDSSRR